MGVGKRIVEALENDGHIDHHGGWSGKDKREVIELIEEAGGISEILDAFEGFIKATEEWNDAVEKIIGKQPRTGIPLSVGKELIKKARE